MKKIFLKKTIFIIATAMFCNKALATNNNTHTTPETAAMMQFIANQNVSQELRNIAKSNLAYYYMMLPGNEQQKIEDYKKAKALCQEIVNDQATDFVTKDTAKKYIQRIERLEDALDLD